MCAELHRILEKGRSFDFRSNTNEIPQNGVYLLYEKGETGHNGDRIVRIGTDTGDNQLRSRIFQHFVNENKNRSIFRKNIGRSMLNRDNSAYLGTWNLDPTTRVNKEKYKGVIDKEFESKIEKQISKYMQESFYFKVFDVSDKDNRLYIERILIGTVSNCRECKPSAKWLGLTSPVDKIRESGLWQVQGLYKSEITKKDLAEIAKHMIM